MSEETKKTAEAPEQEAKETEAAPQEAPETAAAPEKEAEAEPADAKKKDGWFNKKAREMDAVKAKLDAAEKNAAQAKDQLLRMAAEYENYRKRSTREADQKFNDGVSFAVNQIIPILDTLEMAANAPTTDENYKKGVTMTLDKAAKALDRTTLCGDDLTVTNIDYLRKALDMGACGAFVFKPNQVGTVTEAMEAQRYAVDHGMFSIPSIRAGGVSDDPVADMGIAGGAAAVKLGPPKFGHAIHIVNSLLRAETELPEAKPFDFSPFVKF